MLECENLKKVYNRKCVVNDLSFRVEAGEVFALLGSNGAGKTTTIKMILGLTPSDGGTIRKPEDIKTGYSPDMPYFPPFLTGREVLSYYAAIQKIPKTERKNEITSLMQMVGLEDDKTKVKHYSKGMLQRLALAQALLGNPDLLILDEPTADEIELLDALELYMERENLKLIKAENGIRALKLFLQNQGRIYTKQQVNLCEFLRKINIRITDDGEAIDDVLSGQMFSAFVRGDKTRKSDGGTGLGLAISKIIVEKHGGRVEYFREAKNVFVITM